MKTIFYKDDKSYSFDHTPGNPTWIRSQDGDGWGMSEEDEKKLYDAIFDAIDEFFNKNM